MTKKIIKSFRNIVLPYIAKELSRIDYEGMGQDDAEEFSEHFNEILDLAIEALEQTTWIPVSERLPKAFSFVNCTCHSLIDDREDWVVETCYLPQLPDSPYSDWGNIPMLNMGDCEVVAWMYRDIPKPYKVDPQESESDA